MAHPCLTLWHPWMPCCIRQIACSRSCVQAGAEVAHMGMVPAALEDQEALALRLLSGRRGT